MSLVSFYCVLGYLVGPLIILPFINVDVLLGPIHVSYWRACIVFLLVLTTLQTIIVLLFVSNLSAQHDLKEASEVVIATEEEYRVIKDTYPQCEGDMEGDETLTKNYLYSHECAEDVPLCPSSGATRKSTLEVIKLLLTTHDTALLLAITWVSGFWEELLYTGLPYMFQNILHWKPAFLNYSTMGYAFLMSAIAFILSKFKMNGKHLLYLGCKFNL